MFDLNVSKDMKRMPSTSADEKSVRRTMGHPHQNH